jgi:hypothetical protein
MLRGKVEIDCGGLSELLSIDDHYRQPSEILIQTYLRWFDTSFVNVVTLHNDHIILKQTKFVYQSDPTIPVVFRLLQE